MKMEDIMETIKMLAQSQGFYGRLLRQLQEIIKKNDSDSFYEIVEAWEGQNFSDPVDFILYIEG